MLIIGFFIVTGILIYEYAFDQRARADQHRDFVKQPLTTVAGLVGMAALFVFFVGLIIPKLFTLYSLMVVLASLAIGLFAEKRNL
jgi:hypothetical protein